MKQYHFLLYHISTLSTLPQCLCMACAIARRSSVLSVVQTGLLLQALQMKEDDIKIIQQKAPGIRKFKDIKRHAALCCN